MEAAGKELVLLRGPESYSEAKFMDTVQSNKETEHYNEVQRLGKDAERSIKNAVVGALFFVYRRVIREFLRIFGYSGCRFEPSCSHYAEELLRRQSSVIDTPNNFGRILLRISRCNAWSTPYLTFDPPFEDYLPKNI